MGRNNLTIYYDELDMPYIICKDGLSKNFTNLYDAFEGLCEEYPSTEEEENES